MSAAEKLEALEAEMTPGVWGWDERVVNSHNSVYHLTGTVSDIADDVASIADLRNALPEIIAVVKAAELVRRSEGLEGREVEFVGSPFPTSKLAVALSALDEALPDLGVATDSESPPLL